MKVVKASGSDDETYTEIDLGIEGLPNDIKRDIINEAGDFIVEKVLDSLASAKSPVSGESFPALSKKYKAFKVAAGGEGVPNLELEGDLKAALTYRPTDGGLEIGFFGDQAAKADGHLKFSGRENFTPKRRFLPEEGQQFKRDIIQGVEEIVDARAADAIKESDLSGVESSSELYDVLGEIYVGYSRSDIREIVSSNSNLMDLLIDLDLVRFL